MTDMTSAPPSTGVKNSTMAIVSLIAGIVGLTLLPLIGSVTALITGYMARKEIRESAGALSGDGMALAGVIMGWIGVAFAVFGLCMACLLLRPAAAGDHPERPVRLVGRMVGGDLGRQPAGVPSCPEGDRCYD